MIGGRAGDGVRTATRITDRDLLWAGSRTTWWVGPLELPPVAELRRAAVALARAVPDARLRTLLDEPAGRWRETAPAGAALGAHLVQVCEVPDGADRGAALVAAGEAVPAEVPVRWLVCDDHLGLRINHAVGDAGLMIALLTAPVQLARTGAVPPALLVSPAPAPLALALRHHYARRPDRVRQTLGAVRPAVRAPAPGGTRRSSPAPAPSPAVVVAPPRSPRVRDELRAWRAEHARGTSAVAVQVALIGAALREAGLPPRGAPRLLFDARRYLPRGSSVLGNFVAGLDLPVGDVWTPADVDAAIAHAVEAGRPLSAISAGVAVMRARRLVTAARAAGAHPGAGAVAGADLPTGSWDVPTGPVITVTAVGRRAPVEKLAWSAPPEARVFSAAATAAPDGLTACSTDIGPQVLTSLSFHEAVFARSAVERAGELLATDPVGLLERLAPERP